MIRLLIFCFALLGIVNSVYTDEAYVVDWQISNFGSEIIDSSFPDADHYITLSQDGILSVVDNSNNGSLYWRQELNSGKENVAVEGLEELIITAQEDIVQFWNLSSGYLISDFHFDNIKSLTGKVVVEESGDVSVINENNKVSKVGSLNVIVNDIKSSLLNNNNVVVTINDNLIVLVNTKTLKISSVPLSNASKVLTIHQNKIFYLTSNDLINVIEIINHQEVSQDNIKSIKTGYDLTKFHLLDLNNYILADNFEYYSSSVKDKSSIQFTKNINENFFLSIGYNYFRVFDSEFGVELSKYAHTIDIDFEKLISVETFYSGNDLYLILKFNDGLIKSIKNNELLWEHDQSLSNIETTLIFDPSKDLSVQTHDSLTLERYLKGEHLDLDTDSSLIWKPKHLILLTANGKIVSLNMETGNLNWKFDQVTRFSKNNKITSFINDNNKYVKVIFSKGDQLLLDPNNGSLIKFEKAKLPSHEKLIVVNYEDYIKSAIIYNDDFIVKNPYGEFVYVSNNKNAPNNDFFLINKEANKIQSLKFNPSTKSILTTWEFTITPNEKIIGLTSKHENIHSLSSIGVILGDKSTLYKYLYPNLISLAIQDETKNSLIINIIDSITGRVIKSVTHSGNEKIDFNTVKLIQGENYLIYSFYNYHPTVSAKVNVIEFYESLKSDTKSFAGVKYNNVSIFDHDDITPFFQFKSFNFPFKIEQLGLTNTKYDISTKNLIMKLSNGKILTMPKYILNARRIEGRPLTNTEKMEYMNIPYDPNLPINNNAIINHKRVTLGGNSQIFSEPTNLESTSLVCYVGTDIFCTKVYPSLQFDVLSSSFAKNKLLLSILAVIVSCIVTWKMVEERKLNSFWLDQL